MPPGCDDRRLAGSESLSFVERRRNRRHTRRPRRPPRWPGVRFGSVRARSGGGDFSRSSSSASPLTPTVSSSDRHYLQRGSRERTDGRPVEPPCRLRYTRLGALGRQAVGRQRALPDGLGQASRGVRHSGRIVRAKDGVTAQQARAMGAELKTLEGQGSIEHYARSFRNPTVSGQEGRQRALLGRAKG